MGVVLAAKCGVAYCFVRHSVCLQGEIAFSVAIRAAQVSADFLTLPSSKLLPHRLVNSCSRKSQQDNTQFRGLEAKSQGLLVCFLLPFFLQFCLSFTIIFFPLWRALFVRLRVKKTLQVLLGFEPSYTNFYLKVSRSTLVFLGVFFLQDSDVENLARMARWHFVTPANLWQTM